MLYCHSQFPFYLTLILIFTFRRPRCVVFWAESIEVWILPCTQTVGTSLYSLRNHIWIRNGVSSNTNFCFFGHILCRKCVEYLLEPSIRNVFLVTQLMEIYLVDCLFLRAYPQKSMIGRGISDLCRLIRSVSAYGVSKYLLMFWGQYD
jgi:hypothetical protein